MVLDREEIINAKSKFSHHNHDGGRLGVRSSLSGEPDEYEPCSIQQPGEFWSWPDRGYSREALHLVPAGVDAIVVVVYPFFDIVQGAVCCDQCMYHHMGCIIYREGVWFGLIPNFHIFTEAEAG